MSAKNAKQKSPASRAAAQAAKPAVLLPEQEVDQAALKAKIAFLNKLLTSKPSDSEPKLVKKLRAEIAAQNETQQKFNELSQQIQQQQNAIQAANGRVNAIADLLWEEHLEAKPVQ